MVKSKHLFNHALGLTLAATMTACGTPTPDAPIPDAPPMASATLESTTLPAATAGANALAATTRSANAAATDVSAPAPRTDTPPERSGPLMPVATPTAPSPLAIEAMRARDYPGSDITIEQEVAPDRSFQRFVVSYQSDDLKIYALMTVPNGAKPASGWPVILFNHGYIQPEQYRTTERYVAYQAALAREGYITFKSDYRGHGDSEGEPSGHFGPGYTVDVLNALGSLQNHPDVDPTRIGMWGHSLGGEIVLRAMVISRDIKAGVIWAGTVSPPAEQLDRGGHGTRARSGSPGSGPRGLGALAEQYGTPEENPEFWASLSASSYLGDLSGPLQLHHGTADQEVPLSFSQALYDAATQAGETIEFHTYPGSDHNISQEFALAMQRTIAFFDRYLKAE